MAKITRTYYTRRRAGAYRRFYRRYTRRISRKMYNRVSLNYFTAKIGFAFKLAANDNDNYHMYFQELGGAARFAKKLDICDAINDNAEYKNYIPLFNEAKLLGVSIKCVPGNTMNRNTNPIYFYASYKEDNELGDPMILSPTANSYRFFKNFDRKWVPSNQQQAVINQGRDLDFWIFTGSSSSVNNANSPFWTVTVNLIIRFRKNLTL